MSGGILPSAPAYVPLRWAARPIAARSSVLFPEPFGPTKTVGGPGFSVSDDTIQDRHAPGCDRDVLEPDRQIGVGARIVTPPFARPRDVRSRRVR